MKLLQVPMKAFMQQGQSDFAATAVFFLFCFVLTLISVDGWGQLFCLKFFKRLSGLFWIKLVD